MARPSLRLLEQEQRNVSFGNQGRNVNDGESSASDQLSKDRLVCYHFRNSIGYARHLKAVNGEPAKRGFSARLVKVSGYFYFEGGEADDWL